MQRNSTIHEEKLYTRYGPNKQEIALYDAITNSNHKRIKLILQSKIEINWKNRNNYVRIIIK